MTADPVVLLHTDRPEPAVKLLRARHPGLTIATCNTYEGLAAALAGSGAEVVYSVRFAGTPGFPRAALVENLAVRWVSVGGSGTDHLGSWDPAHVTVTNAAGVAADVMAEYALGAMLHFSLDLPGFRRAQERREWVPGRVSTISGKTVLIIGLGHTGQAAARRFRTMQLRVLGVRARPAPTEGADEVHGTEALPELWPRVDFVLICVPLLPSTRGLIGAEAFAKMKPGAVLVDVSRGGVVNEAALMAALDAGTLKGAALDVFAIEPLPADHPLWGYENVIVTPHCSSVFEGWELKAVSMFVDNLARYRRGEPLSNIVDPARGY